MSNRSEAVNFTVTPEWKEIIRNRAMRRGITVSVLMRELIVAAFPELDPNQYTVRPTYQILHEKGEEE